MLNGPITGATQVAGVIGWPVVQSRSPAIHNAAYGALDFDMVYTAFAVAPGHAAQAVAAMRTLGIRGFSVTMPHKADVIGSLDALTETARTLGAVNCITNDAGHLVGDNTDGAGFVAGLRHDTGVEIAGRGVVIVGAGGAARAIVLACAEAGAESVGVINRDGARAEVAAALAESVGYVASSDDLPNAQIVVNATPVGMANTESSGSTALAIEGLAPDAIVVDIVYDPLATPLLMAARSRGLTASGGLPMLVGQASVQIERWVGASPPLDVLLEAARRPL